MSRFFYIPLFLLFAIAIWVPDTEAVNASTEAPLCTQAEELARQWTRSSYMDSHRLFVRCAKDAQDRGDNITAAYSLNEASRLSSVLGEGARGLEEARAAVLQARAAQDANIELTSLSRLLRSLVEAGDILSTEGPAARVQQLIQLSDSSDSRAQGYFALGEMNYHKGGSTDNLRLFRAAVAESAGSNNSLLRSECILYLGFSQIQVGDIEAVRSIEASVDIATRAGDARSRAIGLVALGFGRTIFGSRAEALVAYRQAQEMFPTDFDFTQKARLMNGIATIYEDYGDFPTSIAYRQKALEYFRTVGYPAGELATLPNLAILSFLSGDPASAQSALETSDQLADALGDTYSRATIAEYKGRIAYYVGDYDRSIAHFKVADGLLQKLEMKLPRVKYGLGRALSAAGRRDDAYALFQQSAAENLLDRDFLAASENLFERAKIERSRGRTAEALMTMEESIKYSERPEFHTGQSRLQSHFYSRIHEKYGLMILLLIDSHRDAFNESTSMRTLQLSERARSRSITENLALSDTAFAADADPDVVQQETAVRRQLTIKADALVDQLSRKGAKEEIEILDREINALWNQLEEIKAELKQKSPVYSAIKDPPKFDLADFQANVLGENDVLLEYFLGNEESYLWLVGKHEFEVLVLPGRDLIEAKVDELRRLLEVRKPVEGETFRQVQDRVTDANTRYPAAARELSDMILGPVADRLGGKRLIVVPDGSLHHFPINALPLPRSGTDEPILLTNEVVYQPSAQTLSLLAKFRSDTADGRTRDLLVFSDPVFSRDDPRLSGVETVRPEQASSVPRLRFAESLEGLQRLPSSAEEASEITDIVGSRKTDVFSGFSATRHHLLSAKLSNYKIIHLATHGFVNQERPELSAVILSRFDESGRPIDESVRLQDIYAMKLNADLVVLSACQTGSGKEIKGEGVMGLNNAFLQAGSRSVVASLWPVDDHASNMLMREFYRGMADELSVSSALRNAQLALYRDPQFRSPFFWAAFTLHGDMNRQPAVGSQFSTWWFATVPALVVIGWLMRRRLSRKY